MTRDPPPEIGVQQIDVERRQILRRAHQITAALADGRPEEIPGVLRFLHSYLAEHFAYEDGWMAGAGYPGFQEHARIHAAILEALGDVRNVAGQDPQELVRAAPAFAAALEKHVCTEDVKLVRFLTARENLRLLAEGGPGVGMSLTPLPGSLPPFRPDRG